MTLLSPRSVCRRGLGWMLLGVAMTAALPAAPDLPRAPLAVAFSVDGAKTWGPSQVIEEDLTGWFCYTAIHFTDDAVLLSYCAGNNELGRLSRLRVGRIPLTSLSIPRS